MEQHPPAFSNVGVRSWVVHSERSEESARCVCSLFVGYKNVTRKVGGCDKCD